MDSVNQTAQVLNSKAQGHGHFEKDLPALCLQAASEGIVLLENDGVLPLREKEKVAIFGRVQLDYIYVGYGSGGNVLAPYFINLVDGLEETGRVEMNQNLLSIYKSWCKDNAIPHVSEFAWGQWPYNYEEMPFSEEVVQKAREQSNVAIVVIGRAAGEDRESLLEKGSFYLTDPEKDMLGKVTNAFDKTVVVIDTGNVMDLGWVRDFDISALVLAWQGGMESGRALANVLTGITPASGKLTDTIVRSYESYAGAKDFGGQEFNNYSEDIYVGYRYYESFDKSVVQYPFGYGLSYTTFRTELGSFECSNDQVRISSVVTNIGNAYNGKETLQLYVQCPQGKLGKPLRSLCAFRKTGLLKPGESQSIELSVDLRAIASYDDSGVTGNPYCYVLEEGTYSFYLGSDVRSAQKVGEVKLNRTTITERLSQACAPQKENAFLRIVPQSTDKNPLTLIPATQLVPCSNVDRKALILENQKKEGLVGKALKPSKGYKLSDVKEGRITMDDFVDQLSIEQLVDLCIGEGPMDSKLGIAGNTGTFAGYFESAKDIGVPPVITTDGPAGMRVLSTTTLFPCGTALASTWNTALVQDMMTLAGKELSANKSDILLAPGLNIHRNPLCGRNFEYYSEDPLLSGEMAAAFIKGIQKFGLSACPKHFACNNQETNRIYNDSRVSERALREIYLKGFEICVKKAKPRNLMTSYNKINGVWSHYNYELVTKILRQEWGFDGCVMTDWWMREATDPDFGDTNDAYRVRAQVDVLMPGGWKNVSDNHDSSLIDSFKNGIITLGEIQRSAKNVLAFAMMKL